jgi:hypothetical protein
LEGARPLKGSAAPNLDRVCGPSGVLGLRTFEAQRCAQQVAVQALIEAVARRDRRRSGCGRQQAGVVVRPEIMLEPDLNVGSIMRRDDGSYVTAARRTREADRRLWGEEHCDSPSAFGRQ